MSLFNADEEIRRQREMLKESADVSGEMIADAPNVAMAESLLPVPLSPIEKMIERDGKGKTFGKMLLGGMTGLTPFLMPELIGGNARYKAELDVYNDARKRQLESEQAQPYRMALSNNTKDDDFEAIEKLAVLYPDIYGPVLRDMQKNKYAPNPATYPEGTYQFDPAKGEWYLEQQSSAGDIKKTYMGPDFIPKSRMPGAEYIDKSIYTADQEAFRANGVIQEVDSILGGLDEIERRGGMQTGIAGDFSEVAKDVFGKEDYVTEVRKQYEDIKVRSAINNLPPGVASDKDIELVLAPWPDGTSNPELIRAKLEAIQRVERGRAEYALFESNWLAEKGSRSGLQSAWLNTARGSETVRANQEGKKPRYKVITE